MILDANQQFHVVVILEGGRCLENTLTSLGLGAPDKELQSVSLSLEWHSTTLLHDVIGHPLSAIPKEHYLLFGIGLFVA